MIKALSMYPQHAKAHLILGMIHVLSKHPTQGIAECKRALALDPNLAMAHASIGMAKYYSGRGEETEAHINEAFRLSPRDIFAYVAMHYAGLAKLQIGADAEAAVWLVGVLRPIEIPIRISLSLLRWRKSAGWTMLGLPCERDLRLIQASLFITAASRRTTIRLISLDLSASLTVCAWPACRWINVPCCLTRSLSEAAQRVRLGSA